MLLVYLIFTDVSPPSFSNTCPKDKVIQLESCSRNITVNWTIPVATDNSGIVEVQNPSLEPPVVLSRGVYTINYTAVDATRNYKSCVLKIQVESELKTKLILEKNHNS